jgi:hypothetical protein
MTRKVDTEKLLDRCLKIVQSRVKDLEDKETLSDLDVRSLSNYVDICLTLKKADDKETQEIQKTVSKLSDEQLLEMAK